MKRHKLQDLTAADFMTRDVVWVSPEEALGEVLGKMKSRDVHELPVGRKGKLEGIVTMRELMRRHTLPPTAKVATVLQQPPELDPSTPLPEIAETLITTGFRALPVVQRRKVVGMISRTDLVRALLETGALEGLGVREFMTPNPQCVSEDDTVEHAVHVMQSLGERTIPVVDKHRKLKGALGLKDVVDLFARPKQRKQLGDYGTEREKVALEVKGVMRYPPVTTGADGDLARVAERMLKDNVSSVIVTEEDEPVGVVTKLDLMHSLAGLREREQLFVEIGGLEGEPSETYDLIYDTIQKEIKRIAQLVTPRTLSLHVQKYKPDGDRWKYSLRMRLATTHRMYYANHFDWDLQPALKQLLETLYKRILKEKDRKVTERRLGRSA
ncbi:MAG TPA: CBS domain-containing protein [Thermoplasmata archaeon]|nr:CBS domain-containing protein [Thermoplasmata archaeon]